MIVQGFCSVFFQDLMLAKHNFDATTGDTFKIALYTDQATLNSDTTAYTTTGEVADSGYTAGGLTLTRLGVILSGANAYTDFDDATWNAALTARGALIYNATAAGNPGIYILDFGTNKSSTTTFTVTMPAAAVGTAIIGIQANV